MKNWIRKHSETLPLAGVFLLVLLIFSPALIKQHKTQQRYGFSVSTPEMGRKFISPCEQMVVMRVDSGGAFFNAGIRPADVILDSTWSVTGFMKKLDKKTPGTVFHILTIPDGFAARNCIELSEMKQVEREIVAP